MNLKIQGLPQVQNEDLKKTIENIVDCLGIEVNARDIDVAHRVPSKDKKKPNIVVKFLTRNARDKLLAAAKKTKLSTNQLGFREDEPVYVNEHLCLENKVLLSKARLARREKNWKFVWVTQGKILMRKTEKSPVLHITCAADLEKVI
ncbi:hypothetical protein HPB49_005460 [Dermacentor silvarum]|uniref:Uncharacterized protein n=1 Tax=Dermacentor silvarum TaxID=543639 RepID=A0ACB8DB42_DERSI|nr:hypothetical protein HPB49_005460 [Dermacentor silvarum]